MSFFNPFTNCYSDEPMDLTIGPIEDPTPTYEDIFVNCEKIEIGIPATFLSKVNMLDTQLLLNNYMNSLSLIEVDSTTKAVYALKRMLQQWRLAIKMQNTELMSKSPWLAYLGDFIKPQRIKVVAIPFIDDYIFLYAINPKNMNEIYLFRIDGTNIENYIEQTKYEMYRRGIPEDRGFVCVGVNSTVRFHLDDNYAKLFLSFYNIPMR